MAMALVKQATSIAPLPKALPWFLASSLPEAATTE
jgi:hypothetical protein